MRFDLAAMTRRLRDPRRRRIPLRDIRPAAILATDLYRAGYLPVVQAWERGRDRILAKYERTLAAITQDSPADVEAELDAVERELERLLLVLTPRLRDWALRTERWHRGKWRGAVLSATGVDLQTMIGPEGVAETLQALIGRNVGLAKDISSEARGRIADSVFRGLTERRAARDVARELADAIGMARSRARRVAADQLTKATSALDGERMREAGIEKWKWIHSGKLHARPEHVARNGRVYSFASPPADMPGELPYCGCRKLAVVEFD